MTNHESPAVAWKATRDIQAGDYCITKEGWRLALDAPLEGWRLALAAPLAVDGRPYRWTLEVARPDGRICLEPLYADRMQATLHGVPPAVFWPGRLRATARANERDAQELLEQAGARRRLAQKIESGAEIR